MYLLILIKTVPKKNNKVYQIKTDVIFDGTA